MIVESVEGSGRVQF